MFEWLFFDKFSLIHSFSLYTIFTEFLLEVEVAWTKQAKNFVHKEVDLLYWMQNGLFNI